jgi:hypothetical protein
MKLLLESSAGVEIINIRLLLLVVQVPPGAFASGIALLVSIAEL